MEVKILHELNGVTALAGVDFETHNTHEFRRGKSNLSVSHLVRGAFASDRKIDDIASELHAELKKNPKLEVGFVRGDMHGMPMFFLNRTGDQKKNWQVKFHKTGGVETMHGTHMYVEILRRFKTPPAQALALKARVAKFERELHQ
ncbi:MAG: hypothetical protein V1722_04565 [Candidatus Micrarchaeota archaeon]